MLCLRLLAYLSGLYVQPGRTCGDLANRGYRRRLGRIGLLAWLYFTSCHTLHVLKKFSITIDRSAQFCYINNVPKGDLTIGAKIQAYHDDFYSGFRAEGYRKSAGVPDGVAAPNIKDGRKLTRANIVSEAARYAAAAMSNHEKITAAFALGRQRGVSA